MSEKEEIFVTHLRNTNHKEKPIESSFHSGIQRRQSQTMAKFSDKILVKKKENDEVLKKGGVMAKKSLAKKTVKEKWVLFKDLPQAFPTSHNSIDMYKQPRTKKDFSSELLQVCWILQEAGDFQDGG